MTGMVLEGNDGDCPKCSATLNFEDAEGDYVGDSVFYPVSCMGCGWRGKAFYESVFSHYLSPEGTQ